MRGFTASPLNYGQTLDIFQGPNNNYVVSIALPTGSYKGHCPSSMRFYCIFFEFLSIKSLCIHYRKIPLFIFTVDIRSPDKFSLPRTPLKTSQEDSPESAESKPQRTKSLPHKLPDYNPNTNALTQQRSEGMCITVMIISLSFPCIKQRGVLACLPR